MSRSADTHHELESVIITTGVAVISTVIVMTVTFINAGQKFQGIAQQDLQNTNALHNWAKSICIRASLKDNPEVSQLMPYRPTKQMQWEP